MAFQVTDIVDRDTDQWRELNALPKIELHRHLEGAIRLETLCDIAQQFDIPLPSYEPTELAPHVQMTPDDPATMQAFISKFGILRKFFLDPLVIKRVVREAIEDAAADNVRYMELRFTPNALAKAQGYAFDDVMEWVCSTTEQAARDHRIWVNLIVSMNRHEDLEVAHKTLEAAIAFQGRNVRGLDLAGMEAGFPARPFSPLLRDAKRAGLGLTLHAGEWEGPENVREAIEKIQVDRIGHGVRIVEDSVTAKIAREQGVYFEVCPTSNIQTGVVGLTEHHPLLDMRYLNLPLTINTDDPAIHPTTLTDEYYIAVHVLGMSLRDINELVVNAAHAAFLTDNEREHLMASLRKEMGRSRYRGLQV